MARRRGVGVLGGSVASRGTLFEQTLRDVFPRLCGWLVTVVGDPTVAEDVASEAFVRLLASRSSVQDPTAYVHRVAMNLVRDRWRHQVVVDRTGPVLLVPDLQDAPDLSVRDAVGRLPSRLRDVVVLHYFADLPVAQVATVLDRPVGTVTRSLAEARASLRTALEVP